MQAMTLRARLREVFKPSPPVDIDALARQFGQSVGYAESKFYLRDYPKYNPDELITRKGHKIYAQMMIDEQVKAVVKFKRDAITSRDYYFAFDADVSLSDAEQDRRIRMFTDMLDESSGSFSDGLNLIMKAMTQGFSITEKIIDIFMFEDRPQLGLKKLMAKPYETFGFVTDRYGNIVSTEQEMDGDKQVLELGKFVYFIYNPDVDQHYGESDLRAAYRSWYSKDIAVRMHNMFLERLAGGFTVAKPAVGTTLPVQSREYAQVKAVVENIRSMASVLLPSSLDLEVHDPKSSDAFERAIAMHDLQIAKALLVPNLLGITHQGQTGSYSQAETQLEAFLWTLNADALRLVDCCNEQIFQPLGVLNFQDGYAPKFRFKPVSESKKLQIIKTWNEMVTSKSVQASDTDEEHLRKLLDFPEKGQPLVPVADPNRQLPTRVDGLPDETVIGQPARVVTDVAMSLAVKRVHFTVLDRRARNIESVGADVVEDDLAGMTAYLVTVIQENNLGTPAGSMEMVQTLSFRKRDMAQARSDIDAMLNKAWDLGVRHSVDELARARRERFRADMARIDEQASEFIQTNGFRMLGNMSDDMRSIVQGVLINGIKFSWTTSEIVKRIYDSLMLAGFLKLATGARATGRTEDEVLEALQTSASIHRITTAVRTNVFEAINEARYATFTDPDLGGFVEAIEYSAILDERTTDICRHLDDRIYPANDPVWNSIRPPNHYNCRSILVPVTVIDTEVVGKDHEQDSRWSKPPTKEPQHGFGGETG